VNRDGEPSVWPGRPRDTPGGRATTHRWGHHLSGSLWRARRVGAPLRRQTGTESDLRIPRRLRGDRGRSGRTLRWTIRGPATGRRSLLQGLGGPALLGLRPLAPTQQAVLVRRAQVGPGRPRPAGRRGRLGGRGLRSDRRQLARGNPWFTARARPQPCRDGRARAVSSLRGGRSSPHRPLRGLPSSPPAAAAPSALALAKSASGSEIRGVCSTLVCREGDRYALGTGEFRFVVPVPSGRR
jgi:hypothetical protein